MRTRSFLPACLSAVLLAACGGGGESSGPGSDAAAVQRAAGDSQVAPVSTRLPDSLAVFVTDAADQPVAGVTVHWTVSGGGTVTPSTTQTGVDGIARAARTLGATAGTAGTTAAVNGLPTIQFNATGQVQGAVTMANHTAGALTDTVLGSLIGPEPLPSVLVTDQHGTPVAGVTVTWTASAGGGVTSATVPTDVDGVSTVGYTFGTAAGAYAAHATVTGLQNSPVNFALTATAGAPTQIAKVGGDAVVADPGDNIQVTVQANDAYGNPVAGVTIDWAAASGGGAVNPTQNTTAGNGRATTARTLGVGFGPQTTSATATGLAGSPAVSFNATAAATIAVVNNSFNPNARTIAVGDSVAWQWQGITADHNLTFAATAGQPENATDRTSGTVWRVFSTAGTFNYECTNHAGMTGSITVTP